MVGALGIDLYNTSNVCSMQKILGASPIINGWRLRLWVQDGAFVSSMLTYGHIFLLTWIIACLVIGISFLH